MQLLDKLAYLRLLESKSSKDSLEEVVPAPGIVDEVLSYAEDIFPIFQLKHRKVKHRDLVTTFENESYSFFHIKAYPRKMKETFVIVVSEQQKFIGHILIDLGAEYSQPFLDCPSFDFAGIPSADDLEGMIPQIAPDDDNPFAILIAGKGTFMQTFRTDDGFILEHQMVNTSSHYEVSTLLPADQVVRAMKSYSFGDDKYWLESLSWQRQTLE